MVWGVPDRPRRVITRRTPDAGCRVPVGGCRLPSALRCRRGGVGSVLPDRVDGMTDANLDSAVADAAERPKVLLIVHHTPSPSLQAMLEAVRAGANDPEITGVEVVSRPALGATVSDVLAADAFVLGTPANIGYMSGALKHFFDTVYYPCLEAKVGAPFGLYVHGGSDTTGAVRSVLAVTTGMRWRPVAEPVVAIGPVDRGVEEACRDLGGTVAATVAGW